MANGYEIGETDQRPWGDWAVLDAGPGYAVKRIRVKPGGRLSLQRHKHRGEHWMVVAGEPSVVIGETTRTLATGEHVDIDIGVVHRIENFGAEMAVIIEIQRGATLREDDIERLEDVYGRG